MSREITISPRLDATQLTALSRQAASNESQWWCRHLACMAGNAAKMAAPPGHKDAPE